MTPPGEVGGDDARMEEEKSKGFWNCRSRALFNSKKFYLLQ
jgi:hypothetical protein